jgi:xanthine dehydrogenase YagR molybdenum-binding subunit
MTARVAGAIGEPLPRVDGRLKVTGAARYAAEFELRDIAYGVIVTSTVPHGRIADIDTSEAEQAPGVLVVLTHRNAPRLLLREELPGTTDPSVGHPLMPLQDDRVWHNGQPVALVVADTFERATHAAALVRVTYRPGRAATAFTAAAAHAVAPTMPQRGKQGPGRQQDYQRGEPDRALADSEVQVEATYTTPTEHHNPMEPHATIAAWDGPILTLYDKTQWTQNVQRHVARALGVPAENVRVLSPFVGGAFGAGLRPWANTFLAALAARQLRRPIKVVLTRAQMYTIPGYRPCAVQTLRLGATRQGELVAVQHDATAETSAYEEYSENVVNATRYLYACPNVRTRYRLAALNVNTPTPMRGPGEATGVYALECALDELAVALELDPIALRLRNHADVDPQSGRPWSSKSLRQCYEKAAARFGWERRDPQPRSMRDGRTLIGFGMASATWPTHRRPASARVRILANGTAVVECSTSDIGPGTYTVMTQIAADALGLPVDRVRFDLGDSAMPPAPPQGGSMTVASVGSAVHEAATGARNKVVRLASRDERSPLYGATADLVRADGGFLSWKDDASRGESYADILGRQRQAAVEVTHESKPGDEMRRFSTHAFGAHFVEVRVDRELSTVRVARVVSGFAAGKIINPRTARSQAVGGIVGGIGMALLEQTHRDPRNGRVVNANLADYHIPVHADIPDLDAFFIEEEDPHVNRLGTKGLAELALVGVAAAVANAVYHATGRGVRGLPITPDTLL